MRLTDYTDYSLRVMLYLAVRPDGLSTIQEISDAYGISKNHLMKIVQRLGELGWVETVRGRNGGLRLARAFARADDRRSRAQDGKRFRDRRLLRRRRRGRTAIA